MPMPTEERRDEVLRAIVREYLALAEPVGSETIAAKYHFDVSPATIRNDMAELEVQEMIEQPYTSAGRIPTETGYRFYIHRFIDGQVFVAPQSQTEALAELAHHMERDAEMWYKTFAKMLATMTGETVFMRIGDEITYLTGTSHLFKKPERKNDAVLAMVSSLVDDVDAMLAVADERCSEEVAVLIGTENPFGCELSSVMTRCSAPGMGESIIGIIGPQRMDYDMNVGLIRFIHDVFTK